MAILERIKDAVNLGRNMGGRYILFRTKHELLVRSRLLQKKFPVNPPQVSLPTLAEWKGADSQFFFSDKRSIRLPKNPTPELAQKYQDLRAGKFIFFSSVHFTLSDDYDWATNPETCYKYDKTKHWTEVKDYSKAAGDIKYVWEKSRFSFLYTIIRYDYHFDVACGSFVFNEILSWIDHNPINQGPNFKCSQEISLRVLNWLFALHYYKHDAALTDVVFEKIMHSIYWQLKHVYNNINFSRIAVRNNHAITETLALYVAGMLLPFFDDAVQWKKDGKRWFEQEIAYQIYPDGTYLQFSMNYHRVVVQLLSWAIRLSQLNGEVLNNVVKDRALASLRFLMACMNGEDGNLPNYGANDGALFFPLNDADFRDYRPQLHALSAVLEQGKIDKHNEDIWWYGLTENKKQTLELKNGMLRYPDGGFYLLREQDAFTFIRCGRHKDRPSQADNLHIDVWVQGNNMLRDGGSYKYNADDENLRYFFGTASHNTVMLGNQDQMKKGGRFIWYYWSQALYAGWKEFDEYYEFKGAIKAFRHIGKNITHHRTVRKYKTLLKWEVTDIVDHDTTLPIQQLWHPAVIDGMSVLFQAQDGNGAVLQAMCMKSGYSSYYGIKEESPLIIFSTASKSITTIIEIKES